MYVMCLFSHYWENIHDASECYQLLQGITHHLPNLSWAPVQCTWHNVFLKTSKQEYIIVYTDEKLCMISVAECLLFIVVHIQQILVQLE